jgi:CheY-like chemotaxis protein
MNRILVVEDNVDHAYLMGFILSKEGYQVDVVNTGQEALDQCAQHQYSPIIIDLGLPDMRGDQVVGKLRETASYLNTPVLAYTASNALDEETSKCFVDVISKPVLPQVIRDKIRNWL